MSFKDTVVKIGGSLLRDTATYIDVALNIKRVFIENGYRPFIVVSAAKGITDELINVAKGNKKSLDIVIDRYLDIAKGFSSDKLLRRILQELENLKRIAETLNYIDLSLLDLILSFGERISKILMVEALENIGVKSVELNAKDIIITNNVYGDATIDYEQTLSNLEKVFLSLRNSMVVPVIEGFIGATPDGMITTLGRGGSDYTATAIASLLGFEDVYLVTDVDGIMTTDPDIIPSARIVRYMSYREALEASMYGAKRINPKAFEPLERFYSSKVLIGSWKMFGTEVVKELSSSLYGPKIIMGKRSSDYSYLAIVGEGVSRTKNIRLVLDVLDSEKIELLGIQAYAYRPSLVLYVDNNDMLKALKSLHKALFEGD
ncbi:Aspartate kinase [Ignisphaera aggregans DSM 17230]|uniref:Aspartokinase n=1 Tax=Ignisphaera aggregans (strain DSM 17230 / JCM 13409 / AQ1.S1) TaxID=583356 RepID=E0SS99_IGNAA|nr:Aspartate kinase [Ignisphaera aggregans DSM 17230]